jgi:hypothetical protein
MQPRLQVQRNMFYSPNHAATCSTGLMAPPVPCFALMDGQTFLLTISIEDIISGF